MSSDGIATALQDSASALMAGGNNLEQAVALVAAANKVVQDPNSVGSALRTISLRLRGTSVEILEEMGEETEGVIESTSKLQSKIQALSGVNILTESGDYKDTYTILKEIGQVWEDMADIDQAALLELMAGKNRANTLSAILSNMEDLEGAYNSALNAEGSALKENEAYLDSVQGRMDLFNNAVQSMWMNFINADVIKFVVDMGTGLIKLVDTIGLLPTAAGLFAGWKFAAAELEKSFGKTGVSAKEARKTIVDYINQQKEVANASQEVAAAKQEEAAAEAQAAASAQQERAESAKNTAANTAEAVASEEVKNKKIEEAAAETQATTATQQESATSIQGAAGDEIQTQASQKVTIAKNQETNALLNTKTEEEAEYNSSIKNASGNNVQAGQTGTGNIAGFAATIGKIGTGIKALGIAAGKAALVMIAVKIATEAIGAAWEWLDKEVIHRAEHIKSTVEDLKTEFESTKDALSSNLKTLTDSSNSKIYTTLEDEFAHLAKGVDQYGNNISLTTDQYERYKAICEQIVGINPKLASGYNSASQAIGNNVSVLSELIELQKIQQRQNIRELIKEDNLNDFAEDAYNNIQNVQGQIDVARTRLDQQGNINTMFANDFLTTSDYWNVWGFDFDGAKKSMQEILSVLGYGQEQISGILSQYYDPEMQNYNINGFFSDYIREIYENRQLFNEANIGYITEYFDNTNQQYGESFAVYDQLLADLDGYNDDLLVARDALIETLSQVPLGEKAYDELNDASQKFITDWINNSESFKIDSSMSKEQVQEQFKTNVDQIQRFVQDLSSGKISMTDHGRKITGRDLLDQVYDFDPSTVNWVDYQNQMAEYVKAMWDAIGGENNQYGFKNVGDLTISLGFNFVEDQQELLRDRNIIAQRLNAKVEDINAFLSGLTAAEVQAFYRINWNDADHSEINTLEEIRNAINKQMQFSGEFSISDYAVNISSVSDNISAYKSALESLESGTFTMSDFVSLIEQFPDLADGVDVSSKSFTGLSKNLRRAIKSSPDDLIDDLKELSKKLKDAGKSTDGIEQLISYLEDLPTDNIENLVSKYGELESKINDATRAQLGLQDAMGKNPNAGYETRGDALEYMKDKMSRGEIGSESELWDVAKEYGFKYDNTQSTNYNADELADYIAARDRWYKENEDGTYAYEGIENFMQDVEAAVAQNTKLQELMQWNYDETTGAFSMNFKNSDWDTIVDYLSKTDALTQLTSEEFADLLTQIGQFHDINWSNASDLTSYIQAIAEGSGDASTKIDLMTQSVEKYVEKTLGKDVDFENLTLDNLGDLGDLSEEMKTLLETYVKLRDEFKDPLGVSAAMEGENPLDALMKIENLQNTIKKSGKGLTVVDVDAFADVLKEAGYADEKIQELIETIKTYENIITVTGDDPLGLNQTNKNIETVSAALSALGVECESTTNELGQPISLIIDAPSLIQTLADKGWTSAEISTYISTITSGFSGIPITINGDTSIETIDSIVGKREEITGEETVTVNVDGDASTKIRNMRNDTLYLTSQTHKIKYEFIQFGEKPNLANGTVHLNGTANATGSWGVSRDSTSLVGELGPELLVRNGRWTTIGDNGAEFRQIKKGDIIFNHKQTEDLLSKGYITGRGRISGGLSAFASGTAYMDGNSYFGRYEFDDEGWKEYNVNDKVVDSMDGTTSALKKAADALSNASEEFSEVFDWIEVRMEEIEETLSLLESQIESAVDYSEKNTIINGLIDASKTKLDNLEAGYKKYEAYAEELLTKVPAKYRDAVKDGTIEIEAFVGETDEKTLEAINNYREWAQKAADFKQQANEIITSIRDLAIQKFDNVYESGDIRVAVEDSQTEKLQNQIDLLEEMGEVASSVYYGINGGDAASSTGMFENSYKKIQYLTKTREAMQKELDNAVKAGQLKKGSNEWYELVDQMYEVDAQIHEATMEIEEFQNAINDIYWDNFDKLIDRIGYLKDETQSLIDLMDSDDIVVDPAKRTYKNGTVEYWAASDVKWTNEGLASLGLYAQQMEIAEYEAKQYAEAIDDLTKEYEAGHYSENEYYEKLNELKNAQYDSIEAYEDAKDAIVDLNKTRIDSIKNGIEKEVEAYEELIEKKKEALDAEKDMHDFQKDIMSQQKNISDIERKLAAIANDNSISATAKRKQLEAELAEAQYELEETYYDRSVEDKQNALDKELESFQEEKEAEITKWEEYLENVELVVADSLNVIQANASGIYATLSSKAKEYDLTLSDAILSPWKDGSLAVSDYQDEFYSSMSSTMNQLEALKSKWQEVIDKMTEASKIDVSNINKANETYVAANEKTSSNTNSNNSNKKSNSSNSKSSSTGLSDKDYYGVALAIINGNYGWGGGADRTNRLKSKGFDPDKIQKITDTLYKDKSVHNGTWSGKFYGITDLAPYHYNKYAIGTLGTKKDELALIDELGEELVMHAGKNGKLAFLTKGSSVIPHDISENLMHLGKLDPRDVLDRSRPVINAPHITNNNIELNMEIAEVVHIDTVTNETIPNLTKAIEKQMDKYMKNINAEIRKYSR